MPARKPKKQGPPACDSCGKQVKTRRLESGWRLCFPCTQKHNAVTAGGKA